MTNDGDNSCTGLAKNRSNFDFRKILAQNNITNL